MLLPPQGPGFWFFVFFCFDLVWFFLLFLLCNKIIVSHLAVIILLFFYSSPTLIQSFPWEGLCMQKGQKVFIENHFIQLN